MRILKRQSGMTVIELVVASVIALVFVLAAATGYLVNQKAYSRNNEKLELQQTAAHVMEVMEKAIRGAATAKIFGGNEIRVYDNTGTQITRFRLQTSGTETKLYEQSTVLARQKLIQLSFVPNADTTTVRLVVQLQDKYMNNVTLQAAATLRNNRKLRNLGPGEF